MLTEEAREINSRKEKKRRLNEELSYEEQLRVQASILYQREFE